MSEIHESSLKIREIPLQLVYSDAELNCRGQIAPIDVIELANDIKANGLHQPISVHPFTVVEGKSYRIIMGHRRFAACQLAGLRTVSAIIRDNVTERDIRFMNLAENVNRKDLNLMQEANAVQKLVLLGETQEAIAQTLNMSRGWVQVRIMLMDLPREIQQDAAAGLLRAVDIRDLTKLRDRTLQLAKAKELKDAQILGKRQRPDVLKSENTKKPRSREELFEIQDTLYELFSGHTLATKVIAWASGEIDTLEMHQNIAEEAKKAGLAYTIPPEYTKVIV